MDVFGKILKKNRKLVFFDSMPEALLIKRSITNRKNVKGVNCDVLRGFWANM